MYTPAKLEDAFGEMGISLDGTHFLIAYSGGLDSTVLMESMRHLAREHEMALTLSHANHQLRSDSAQDELFCREIAQKAGLPFHSILLDPSTRGQESIEAWARRERYAQLEQLRASLKAHWILTAHHADDQIETVLMRLMQKSALLGLAGIRPRREYIVRPLLHYAKSELHEWAMSRNLSWIEDPSNTDLKYLRNRLRHGMIGQLTTTEPNHRRTLLELAHLAQDYEHQCSNLAAGIAAEAREGSIPGAVVISKELLTSIIEEDVFKLSIKRLVSENLGIAAQLSAQHWHSFRHFVLKSTAGKVFDLSTDVQVLSDRSELIFYHRSRAIPPKPSELESGTTKWGFHEFLATASQSGSVPGLWVRSWDHGDRVRVLPGDHTKLVSDLYIDSKMNRLEKLHWPVITTQRDDIVWVPGLSDPATTLKRDQWEIRWQTKIHRR